MAETLIPVLDRGKAAAFDRWMAQGGRLPGNESLGRGGHKTGVFTRGPMKGLTYDEAKQRFEQMWGSASPEVRAKYEARAQGPVTPVGNAELNASRPGESYTQTLERQRLARGGKKTVVARPAHDRDGNGVPDMIQRVGGGGEAVAKTQAQQASDRNAAANQRVVDAGGQVNIGTPEEQARVAAMMNEGEGYQTATVGNYLGMEAAVAMGRASGAPESSNPEIQAELNQKREVERQAAAQAAAAAEQKEKDARIAAERQRLGLAVNKAPSPTPGKMPAPGTPVTPGMPTDARMHAQGKTNTGGVPAEKALVDPAKREVVTTGVTAVEKPRINKLTGLSFGAMPGETDRLNAGQKATADRMAAERAAQGVPVARPSDAAGAQNVMESIGATPVGSMTRGAPRAATAVTRPTGRADGYVARSPIEETRLQMERERAAAARLAAGPTQANPPGLTLVGPKRPLNELVARNAVRGLGRTAIPMPR